MSESQVHLDRRTVKFSFIWTAIETYAGQGIQFIIGIILARLLMPTDYGAVGVITVFLSLSTAIISAGFPTALLKKQDCQHIDYCTVFYFNLGIGLFLSIILYVCAPYIARFFNMPILDHVTKAMTLTIFFPAISGVSHVILRKNLKFKLIASITILISILSGIIGIILAFCGYGVWA
ncbi:oligosaccharide flippase family protein, partial [Paramuribaculum intestinale]